MTAETYKDILEECLLPEISSCNVPMVFMQDNSPCHKAKSVLQFFDDHAITTLDCTRFESDREFVVDNQIQKVEKIRFTDQQK